MRLITILAIIVTLLITVAQFCVGNIPAFFGWGNATCWALFYLIKSDDDKKEEQEDV